MMSVLMQARVPTALMAPETAVQEVRPVREAVPDRAQEGPDFRLLVAAVLQRSAAMRSLMARQAVMAMVPVAMAALAVAVVLVDLVAKAVAEVDTVAVAEQAAAVQAEAAVEVRSTLARAKSTLQVPTRATGQ